MEDLSTSPLGPSPASSALWRSLVRAGLPQQLWSFPSWHRVEVPPGRWSQEVSPPPLPPSPVSPGGSSHLLPLSLLGRKGGRDGQLVPRGHQCRGRCPTGAGCWPLPPRARLHRSARPGPARLGSARLGSAGRRGSPLAAAGGAGRGGAPPLSGSSRRVLPGAARLQQAAAAERAAAGRAGRAGQGRRAPRHRPRRRRQDDRRQQHQQQRGAHAVPLHVLGALRAQLPRRGDLLLRLAPALPHPQAGALHRPGGQPPPEPPQEEAGKRRGRRSGRRRGGMRSALRPGGDTGGRTDGRTRPDSGRPARRPARPLREPQPWRGCSEQPAPSPSPACFLRSRVPIRPPPPEGPPLRPCHSPPIPPRARG